MYSRGGGNVMESDQALDECRRGRLTVTGSRLGLSTPKRAYLASLDLAPLCFVRYTVHSALLLLLLSSRWLEQSAGHDVLLSFGGATDAISSGAIKGSQGGGTVRPSRPFFHRLLLHTIALYPPYLCAFLCSDPLSTGHRQLEGDLE